MSLTNDGVHIMKILSETSCKKHGADVGTACWHIPIGVSRNDAPAVCGARIKRAGFNGKISYSSMNTRSSVKRK